MNGSKNGDENPLNSDFLTEKDVARFWQKVDVQGVDDCWNWQDADRRGPGVGANHGSIKIQGKTYYAHRLAYVIANGVTIRSTDVIRHKCNNPPCCNFKHLVSGSHADNVMDRVRSNRSALGSRNGRAKLTEEQALFIKHCALKPSELAKHFKVDQKSIYDIRNGVNWRYIQDLPAPTNLSLDSYTSITSQAA